MTAVCRGRVEAARKWFGRPRHGSSTRSIWARCFRELSNTLNLYSVYSVSFGSTFRGVGKTA